MPPLLRLLACIVLCIAGSACTFAQEMSPDSLAAFETRDAGAPYLVESPTLNFRKEITVYGSAQAALYVLAGKYGAIPTPLLKASVGVSLLKGRLFAELGPNQYAFFNYEDSKPLMFGVRGVIAKTEEVNLGAGYYYQDLTEGWKALNDNLWGLDLQTFYAALTWNPGRNTFTLNPGFSFRTEHKWRGETSAQQFWNLMLGMNIYLGESIRLISDFGIYKVEVNENYAWWWTGVRFVGEHVSVDLSTLLLLAYSFKISVAL